MNKTEFITVRLPEDVMQKLRAEAKRNTRSLSAQVLHYLKQGLEKVKS
jgi:plasmid stability protein